MLEVGGAHHKLHKGANISSWPLNGTPNRGVGINVAMQRIDSRGRCEIVNRLLHLTVNIEGANQRRGLAGVDGCDSHLGKSLMQAVVHVVPNGLYAGVCKCSMNFRCYLWHGSRETRVLSFIKLVIDSRIYIRCGQVRRLCPRAQR
ncbi:hypothetical protein BN2476_1420001 [Paraburkholderia piptadeniae]|uniref:Uncharacterized protein n=1 Tax=Paraburkholderia piptadeniae TaxID=1701573 RepID=A0A1N7SWD3_9BURK|nr:hypothetical protein BN2476_1420001 [Paraburkholderia piptadeniae]